jgi:hypothetical protein
MLWELFLLSHKMYLWISCTCDLISALLDPGGDTKLGTDVMVRGIIFQIGGLTIFIFVILASPLHCVICYIFLHLMIRMIKLLITTMATSVAFIYIQSAYRNIELMDWIPY